MQTEAVIKAALNVSAKHPDWEIVPEIMIPLVGEVKELAYVKKVVTTTADKLIAEAGSSMKYKVGTMIEIPRAALTADEIAKEAEYFSFGTNDLTQMTFGFSRDDAGKFLGASTTRRSTKTIPSQNSTRLALANWLRWLANWAKLPDPTSNWASAANMAATRALSSSATTLV